MTGLPEPTVLIGRATKVNYGVRTNGDTIKIWSSDFAADMMEAVEEQT